MAKKTLNSFQQRETPFFKPRPKSYGVSVPPGNKEEYQEAIERAEKGLPPKRPIDPRSPENIMALNKKYQERQERLKQMQEEYWSRHPEARPPLEAPPHGESEESLSTSDTAQLQSSAEADGQKNEPEERAAKSYSEQQAQSSSSASVPPGPHPNTDKNCSTESKTQNGTNEPTTSAKSPSERDAHTEEDSSKFTADATASNTGTDSSGPPKQPPDGNSGAGGGRAEGEESEPPPKYKRSREAFAHKTVTLTKSYSGSSEATEVSTLERWYFALRFFFTREKFVGKDRFGNCFFARWYFYRTRHEERRCYRKDRDKRHQPYGALPTDSRLWEAWQRNFRHDPPTREEEEFFREKKRERMGPHVMEDETVEDAIVRSFAHTNAASPILQELDPDDSFNKFLDSNHHRWKDQHPEIGGSWTVGFVRGDVFYNEEQTETMRETLQHMFRDREWQVLEMKRQSRLRRAKPPAGKPPDGVFDPKEAQDLTNPQQFSWLDYRPDNAVSFDLGIPDITTPELEKLRYECDALEDERLALQKELGLTDLGDMRDGRAPIDKGYDPFQPPPTSKRWKPKCWGEAWGDRLAAGGLSVDPV